MKVSAEAATLYERVNQVWRDAEIPLNRYSQQLWDKRHHIEDTEAALRFVNAAGEIEWGGMRKWTWRPVDRVKITTGNRITWVYMCRGGKELQLNTSKGWFDLVHLYSHYLWRRFEGWKHYSSTPHNADHAAMELRLSKLAQQFI
jgi:hypothetical protein